MAEKALPDVRRALTEYIDKLSPVADEIMKETIEECCKLATEGRNAADCNLGQKLVQYSRQAAALKDLLLQKFKECGQFSGVHYLLKAGHGDDDDPIDTDTIHLEWKPYEKVADNDQQNFPV
jgi:hypothetical protein